MWPLSFATAPVGTAQLSVTEPQASKVHGQRLTGPSGKAHESVDLPPASWRDGSPAFDH